MGTNVNRWAIRMYFCLKIKQMNTTRSTYRDCFGVQLGENEVSSFEIVVQIKDGTMAEEG